MLAGCGEPARIGVGEPTSIIVVAADSLWAEVGDSLTVALEPSVFTVRDESTFEITHVSPESEDWRSLRRFRQILAIGMRDDFWIAAALEGAGEVGTPPTVVEVENVWVRNQTVTVLVLPDGGDGEAVLSRADALNDRFDSRFREYAQRRMFVSGVNDSLRTTLVSGPGVSLSVPRLYRWRAVADTAYLMINDNPSADRLLRMIFLGWSEGIADTLTTERVLALRQQVSQRYYDWGQTTESDRVEAARLEGSDARGLQVRGIWSGTVEGWPQAGPFISRMIVCAAQDRTYFLDAWLYAPGEKKYEYIIQLETILGSFGC